MSGSDRLFSIFSIAGVVFVASGAWAQDPSPPLQFPVFIDKALCDPVNIGRLPSGTLPIPSGVSPTGSDLTSAEQKRVYSVLVTQRDQVILYKRDLDEKISKQNKKISDQFAKFHIYYDTGTPFPIEFQYGPDGTGSSVTESLDVASTAAKRGDEISYYTKEDRAKYFPVFWNQFTRDLKGLGTLQGDAAGMFSADHIVRNRTVAAMVVVYHRFCAQAGDQSSSCQDKDEAARYQKLLTAFDSRFERDAKESLCGLRDRLTLNEAHAKAVGQLKELNASMNRLANYGAEPLKGERGNSTSESSM